MHQVFFNLLLVLLPTQLGYHMWPEWAMVLGRRVDYLSPTLYGTDILIVLILVSSIVHERKIYSISNFQFLIKRNIFQLITYKTLVILGFVGVNIFFATNRLVSAYFWLKVLEYIFLGFYIVKTKQKTSSIIFFLSIGVLYSSIIAIAQFVLQKSIGGPLWFLGERTFSNLMPGIAQFNVCKPFSSTCTLVLRAYGTLPHPNVLGGYIAVMLPLVIHQLRHRKIFYLATLLAGITALVMTFSRSAWIACLFGTGIVLYARPPVGSAIWKQSKAYFSAIFASMVIIIFIAGTTGFHDESVVVREALNNSAISMFTESPLVGKGLGNFLVALPANLPSRQIYFLQPVHNIYLLVLAETGVVGLALFIWMIWKIFKSKKTIIRYSLFIILLLGLVDHYPLTLQQGQLLLTILLSSTIAL